ncbi:uncharacterized protein LOC143287375 [Babylonia areolata]|uniref:uncharacterized protein LOC143287375 n=1 Tax=Babylonia areolata TaxID=304850 RepID=UPI003FD64199
MTMLSHSLAESVGLTVMFITTVQLLSSVSCVPLTVGEVEERDMALYDSLHQALSEAILQDMASDTSRLASLRHLPAIPRPHFFPRTPTDTPSLADLMRSALQPQPQNFRPGSQTFPLPAEEGKQPPARKEAEVAWKKQGREARKRSFDSISRSSGFGLQRGSWGGGPRYSDNLTFTFESLFPAIVRGLRSIR